MIPRAYWPAPEGTQFLNLGYSNTSGDIVPDPTLPVRGSESGIDTLLAGYVRYFDLSGRTANIKLEGAYSKGETRVLVSDGSRIVGDFQGMGDIAATLTFNLIGAPALDHDEFMELRENPRPLLGASIKLVAPTGDYDSEKIINVGANRWAGKAELSFITALHPKWLLETELGVWGFTPNDDFLGQTLKQDAIWALELHLVRRFSPGFWISLDGNWYRGGETELDGEGRGDLQRDATLGATLVYPFHRGHALKINYSKGSVVDSAENFTVFGLAYVNRF